MVTDASDTTIAHSAVYNVRLTGEDLRAENCTEAAVCRVTKRSRWLGDQLCRATAICTTLSDGSCADFGIELDFGGEEVERVCREGELHSGELAPGQELAASVWFTRRSADMEVECYFWCTEDGEVPVRDPDRVDASEQLENLVRMPFSWYKVPAVRAIKYYQDGPNAFFS